MDMTALRAAGILLVTMATSPFPAVADDVPDRSVASDVQRVAYDIGVATVLGVRCARVRSNTQQRDRLIKDYRVGHEAEFDVANLKGMTVTRERMAKFKPGKICGDASRDYGFHGKIQPRLLRNRTRDDVDANLSDLD